MDPNVIASSGQPEPAKPEASSSGGAAPPPDISIPDHTLLRCIGRGSYGTVWLARNMMGMYRAVKIVHRSSFKDHRPFERELSGIRKFEPISRSHEGFLDVLHVGINEAQGYFYYVMELGDDQTTEQNIDPEKYTPKTLAKEIGLRGKLSARECLQLGLALTHALHELHGHGLVHRDVKPANIVFVNGTPKLADIGLVAEFEEARSYVGTEGFIPPEGPGTPQADIYSLGKVLYEASTGKDRQDFPALPTLLESLPDTSDFLELNEVILSACRPDTASRYHFAWDMHADLLVLANGKSVKRLKLLEQRLARWRRWVGIVTLVGLVAAAVLYQIYREWRRVDEARQRRVGANVAYGNQAVASGVLPDALPYYAEALRLEGNDAGRAATHRLRFGAALAQCPKLAQLWFVGQEVTTARFSPDGDRMLMIQSRGKAAIFDLKQAGRPGRFFGTTSMLGGGAFSPDGRYVAWVGTDNTVYVTDAESLKVVGELPHGEAVFSVEFNPCDAGKLVTASLDGVARVWAWRTKDRRPELELERRGIPMHFAGFSHDGKLLVTTSDDGTAQVWDAKSGREALPPLIHGITWVTCAAFSPDDRRLITGSFDRTAKVWELEPGRARRIPVDLRHLDGVSSVEFSPDGRLIVTASLDRTVRLWRADTLQPLGPNPILRQGDRVLHASFSPDSRNIVSTCVDGAVRVWDLAGSAMPPRMVQGWFSADWSRFVAITNNELVVCDSVTGQAVSPPLTAKGSLEKAELSGNGKFVWAVSVTGTNEGLKTRLVQTWDAEGGREMGPAVVNSNGLDGIALGNDARCLAVFSGNELQLWNVASGTMSMPSLFLENPINGVVISPDGTKVAVRSGNQAHVWRTIDGQAQFEPLPHPATVMHLEFSPDGGRLLTCCSDTQFAVRHAQVWDSVTGKPVGPRLKHGDGVLWGSFSADGLRVVTGGEDFQAMLWDAANGRQLAPALPHENQVWTAAFSRDGKWLVTGSADYKLRIWSAETGEPLTPPVVTPKWIDRVGFLPNGKSIVATDQFGNAMIWELPVDRRPVEELKELARLLSAGAVAPAGELTRRPAGKSLEADWKRLRALYSGDFSASEEEIAAWKKYATQIPEGE